MKTQMPTRTDASGRGVAEGWAVSYPSLMYRYNEDEIQAVVRVMRDGASMSQGEYLEQFEADFRRFTGASHAFAVSSGTSALQLAGTLCGVRPGDEIIIPAYTFCATAIPFGPTGAKIVWADIDPKTWVASPEDIARKITPRTRAIVAVHLLGMPVDMDPILELASRHGIAVIEDCAQAPGASYKGRRVGSIGDYGCFSFNGAKNLTTLGEGGMLTVKNEKKAALVAGLRHNGIRAFSGERAYYWVPAMSNVDTDIEGVWPTKLCLGEAQCALGSALLNRLDCVNEGLRRQREYLRGKLSACGEISFQYEPSGHHAIFHCCVACFEGGELGKTREDFMSLMTKKHGIRLIVQYYPLYRYPLFKKMGFGEADCPNLETFWSNSFSYPWCLDIGEEKLDYMADRTYQSIIELKG